MIQYYSLGFAFNTTRSLVAVIEKQKPVWQKGKLNGIGGKVEKTDLTAAHAQEREFAEETGVVIPAHLWRHFATLHGQDYMVDCFVTFTDEIFKTRTQTDEKVLLAQVDEKGCPRGNIACIHNLAYLVPLAIDETMVNIPDFSYWKDVLNGLPDL